MAVSCDYPNVEIETSMYSTATSVIVIRQQVRLSLTFHYFAVFQQQQRRARRCDNLILTRVLIESCRRSGAPSTVRRIR